MHILGNILIFIILVVLVYKIGSVYMKWSDDKRFKKRLQDEIRKQKEED
ncbi:MAG: hypothetical protein HKP55_07500 [Gammaproteobacteria bacterium]|nr:hypothetical protein [Gammaproteobacteria bacterium]